jgi:hypothetical protein
LNRNNFDVIEDYGYNMNNRDKRDVKRIIFDYFEYIEEEWDKFERRKKSRSITI